MRYYKAYNSITMSYYWKFSFIKQENKWFFSSEQGSTIIFYDW